MSTMLAVAPSFVLNQQGQAVVVFFLTSSCLLYFYLQQSSSTQMHKAKHQVLNATLKLPHACAVTRRHRTIL